MTQKQIELLQKVLSQNRQLRRVTRQLSAQVANKRQVTYTQLLTLEILKTHPGLNLNELAAQLHLSKSSVSGIVDRLLKNKLIYKQKKIADQRQLTLHLTQTGSKLAISAYAEFYEQLTALLDLDTEELEQYLTIQLKIIKKLEAVYQ
ncbi:MarR family winged helix-turn-helix transcriptional regulator [Agrilactobacillus fermenti]|uniref:MarR family winged helix-turn-helix transcriptional regulator n=1 Tax=Agrilactobacillus fermenti TaxID=2586909 RepID=UPI001E46343E|nr:MarR family transcriptional regulator [Agrilactobacillus fermenti]MCD2255713.1 MarR family transcriptional regulator [Agrilactobacillus fermenti]